MPRVFVYLNTQRSPLLEGWLRRNLQGLVADHLGAEGPASLTASDITVHFRRLRLRDLTKYTVDIEITANPYPERNEIAQRGVQRILDRIHEEFEWLKPGKVSVWAPLSLAFTDKPTDAKPG